MNGTVYRHLGILQSYTVAHNLQSSMRSRPARTHSCAVCRAGSSLARDRERPPPRRAGRGAGGGPARPAGMRSVEYALSTSTEYARPLSNLITSKQGN
jgi:hypothetical protein